MTSSVRFWLLLTVLLCAGAFVNAWAHFGEAHVERRELKYFPPQLGAWKQVGVDETLDVQTLSVLRTSDYLLRSYAAANRGPANLYIGYFATQRDGTSYHSPLNCLPGSGWMMVDAAPLTIDANNGTKFVANQYVIENNDHRELIIYWYQGRGRTIASEYWAKVYTVLDSVERRRSDAALVRITVPIITSKDAALQAARDFAGSAAAVLPDYVPN